MSRWPAELPAVQVRVARPTNKLDEVVRFYTKGLGLTVVGSFQGEEYDGVMIGLPGVGYHLEFTSHREGSPGLAPTKDNLLVFYLADKTARDQAVGRLVMMGYLVVEPENPYWAAHGKTIEDPDGWRVVLVHGEGISPPKAR